METVIKDPLYLSVQIVLTGWKEYVNRAAALLEQLSDEQLAQQVAPGKNRGVYLLGHLIAVHDKIVPLLGIGERNYESYDMPFLLSPDSAAASFPDTSELRAAWKALHERLNRDLAVLPAEAWFERHHAVSEEDFAKQPHRNKLALFLTRTTHLAYHYGQLLLLK